MVWAPSEATRVAVKFWLDCLQVVTVVAGVSTAVGTFVYHSRGQQARAIEQDARADEQLAAAKRDLQRRTNAGEAAAAIELARGASREIRDQWERIGR